ncbi:cadherin-23-like [Gigantopelta aegis]|uniref:cadherin-23-like n=1 Tax=Gigantopelta aegis TaxID=1735272 RepID=UPI001B8897FA|nr:cadherin-23-like [Gigantopelta aegis]
MIGDGSAMSYFTLEAGRTSQLSAVISTKNSLLTDNVEKYSIRIVASDNGFPARSATAIVIVNMQRNFFGPVWQAPSYSTNVLETQALGVAIVSVKATDGDTQSPNNIVFYQLIGDVAALNYFHINEVTGQISVGTSLTADESDPVQYKLTVRALDRGSPPLTSTADVRVFVNVVRNQNPPQFINEPYSQSVRQDLSTSASILKVKAVDPDTQGSFGDIEYRMINIDTSQTYFQVDAKSGIISLRNSVASDTTTEYRLLIQAADQGSPPQTDLTVIVITVNRNLAAPMFVPRVYNVTILETQSLGDTITRVTATDSDIVSPNNVVKYALLGTAKALEYFFVNSVTGDVSVRRGLTEDVTSSNNRYMLTVAAEDQGLPAPLRALWSATVNVLVVRNQFEPVFENTPYRATVSLATDVGSSVFRVVATDRDLQVPYNTVVYSAIGDDSAPSFFQVNGATGDVYMTQSIVSDTATSYRLRVVAKDGGNPAKSAYEVITLTIDRNLFAPQWMQPSGPNYMTSTTVFENTDFSTIIFKLVAIDSDNTSPYNQVVYSFVGNSPGQAYFMLDANTGQIRLRTSLLQDSAQQYTLLATASDSTKPARSAPQTATVQVSVIRNLNTPNFVNLPYSTHIAESLSLGASVYQATAVDIDQQNTFERVHYEIVGDDSAPVYFRINQASGQISLRRSLVGVSKNSFYVRVRAYDNGLPTPRSNTTMVRIMILHNLNAPVISSSSYQATVPATEPVGSVIVQVKATDADNASPHNEIRFSSRADSMEEDFFFVNSVTGEVTVRRSLTLDTQLSSVYVLFVGAYDLGSPSRQAGQESRISITVTRNRFSPVFVGDPYTVTIPETQSVGSSVALITVTDADNVAPFNAVTLRTIGDDLAANYFSVNSSGVVYVTGKLVSDTVHFYRLRIEAQDGGMPPKSATALVNINVQINLFDPVFSSSSYVGNILETTELGVSIVQVLASDRDSRPAHSTIRYSISNNSASSFGREFFLIDAVSGTVSLRQSVLKDQRQLSQYVFQVNAVDTGVPKRMATNPATVTVNVVRNKSPPVFLNQPYSVRVNRTIAVGISLLTVRTRDQDQSGPYSSVVFDIIGDDVAPVFFSVGAVSGVVKLKETIVLDKATYSLRVRAMDGGKPPLSATAVVTIRVDTNLFSPTFDQNSYRVAITDLTTPGSFVVQVAAHDLDTDVLTYSIIGDDTASNIFSINSATGVITASNAIRTDTSLSYRIRVEVSDDGSPRRTDLTLVYVNMTRNLFSPEFRPVTYNTILEETHAVGDPFAAVFATDSDAAVPNNVVEYLLSGSLEMTSLFQVGLLSGQLSLLRPLYADTNKPSAYSFMVTAHDKGSPSRAAINTATVTVAVKRNIHAPEFLNTPYSAVIFRTLGTSASIMQITTVDRDETSPFNEVSLEVIGDDTAPSLFSLGSDSIVRVTNNVDLAQDTATVYRLRLLAHDGGFPSLSATTTIEITVRRNLFAPVFTNAEAIRVVILENLVAGSFIADVKATDSDADPPNNVVTYVITGAAEAGRYFFINPVDGRVSLLQSVVGTAVNGYRLVIEARDGGFPRLVSSTIVEVTVIRDTDTLVFPLASYVMTISENYRVGQAVLTVDAQPAPGISYRLTGFSDGPDYFKIDGTSGEITVKSTLHADLNKKTMYYLTVEATKLFNVGMKTATTQVNITVTRNENAPVFSRRIYQVTMSESASLGSSVQQLLATDADAQDVLVYSFHPQTDVTTIFYLGPSSGLISLRKRLLGDSTDVYQFSVIASDKSIPARSATATVIVEIQRDRFLLQFINEPYGEAVSLHTPPGTIVYSVRATDQDLMGEVMYKMIGYFSAPGYFVMDANTGDISVHSSLLTDVTAVYVIGVIAYDSAYPTNHASSNVTISVNRNPNRPVFNPSSYAERIPESFPLGTSLLRVQATDDDAGQIVRYEIVSSTPQEGTNFFYLNSETGLITATRPLTETASNGFMFIIHSYDNGSPIRQSNTNAQVTISIDRNQFGPQFVGEPYETTIRETLTISSSVLTLSARDSDPETSAFANVTYVLIGDDTMPSYFSLNKWTGMVSVRADLVAETRPQYQGRVVASDSGHPPRSATAIVKINVIRNLHHPQFQQSSYQTNVLETVGVGASVLSVQALDNDIRSPFNTVQYEMENANSLGSMYFHVDISTGVISVRTPLTGDHLRSKVYNG